MARYTELETYYYSSDHMGRPYNLRAQDRALRWCMNWHPFGETLDSDTTSGPMPAGSGAFRVAWQPGFRFPGQWEDPEGDMGTADNSRPLFVQNHYREYMPRFGRYNRPDPLLSLIRQEYSYG